jgi:hypothetical protein
MLFYRGRLTVTERRTASTSGETAQDAEDAARAMDDYWG